MEYMEDNLDDWLADELEVSTGPSSVAVLQRRRSHCNEVAGPSMLLTSPSRKTCALRWFTHASAVPHTSKAASLQAYGEDDYLIFDCPGQIELYSHVSVFRTLVDWMRGQGWSMCAVYCLDCQFITETPKFIAGAGLAARAAGESCSLPTACPMLVRHRYLLDWQTPVLLLSAWLGRAVLAAALLADCAVADLVRCCREPAGSVCHGAAGAAPCQCLDQGGPAVRQGEAARCLLSAAECILGWCASRLPRMDLLCQSILAAVSACLCCRQCLTPSCTQTPGKWRLSCLHRLAQALEK